MTTTPTRTGDGLDLRTIRAAAIQTPTMQLSAHSFTDGAITIQVETRGGGPCARPIALDLGSLDYLIAQLTRMRADVAGLAEPADEGRAA